MNYELLYKLAIEENDKLKTETTVFKKRNEILRHEIEKFETLIKSIEEEKITLKSQMDSLKNEIDLLKSALEFREEEKQHYSHYS
jgi:predicted  nucleic acid-binding Zn-ribbon protein